MGIDKPTEIPVDKVKKIRRYLLIYFVFCIWELCNLDSLCLSLIALQNAFDEVTFFKVACSLSQVNQARLVFFCRKQTREYVLLFGLKVLCLLW